MEWLSNIIIIIATIGMIIIIFKISKEEKKIKLLGKRINKAKFKFNRWLYNGIFGVLMCIMLSDRGTVLFIYSLGSTFYMIFRGFRREGIFEAGIYSNIGIFFWDEITKIRWVEALNDDNIMGIEFINGEGDNAIEIYFGLNSAELDKAKKTVCLNRK